VEITGKNIIWKFLFAAYRILSILVFKYKNILLLAVGLGEALSHFSGWLFNRGYHEGERVMRIFHHLFLAIASVAMVASTQCVLAEHGNTSAMKSIERGRYLVKITGCNDCHTPGYAETGGKIPEQKWLTGDQLGWHGPWGTTYPSNLRLYMSGISEEQWVQHAHTVQYRPPMPWFALRDMASQDLRAIYRFVKYLGPAGEAAPAYLPPGQEPKGAFVQFPLPPKSLTTGK